MNYVRYYLFKKENYYYIYNASNLWEELKTLSGKTWHIPLYTFTPLTKEDAMEFVKIKGCANTSFNYYKKFFK